MYRMQNVEEKNIECRRKKSPPRARQKTKVGPRKLRLIIVGQPTQYRALGHIWCSFGGPFALDIFPGLCHFVSRGKYLLIHAFDQSLTKRNFWGPVWAFWWALPYSV